MCPQNCKIYVWSIRRNWVRKKKNSKYTFCVYSIFYTYTHQKATTTLIFFYIIFEKAIKPRVSASERSGYGEREKTGSRAIFQSNKSQSLFHNLSPRLCWKLLCARRWRKELETGLKVEIKESYWNRPANRPRSSEKARDFKALKFYEMMHSKKYFITFFLMLLNPFIGELVNFLSVINLLSVHFSTNTQIFIIINSNHKIKD